MPSRDKIFAKIRSALEAVPEAERAQYPEWDSALATCHAHPDFNTPWELFSHKCRGTSGVVLDSPADLGIYLKEQDLKFGYCDPELHDLVMEVAPEGVRLETTFDRSKVDAYQFGITRAAAVIAETGSIVLMEGVTHSRLAALAPWVHIAMVLEDEVLPDVASALETFGDDPNIIFVTGPSKTADVEGILIEGVHGPGVQVCCRM